MTTILSFASANVLSDLNYKHIFGILKSWKMLRETDFVTKHR